VGAVYQQRWPLRPALQHLEPPGPFDGGQTALHVSHGQAGEVTAGPLQRRQSHGGVERLVLARQADDERRAGGNEPRFRAAAGDKALAGRATVVAASDLVGPIAADNGQRRAALGGDPFQGGQGLRLLGRRDDRHAGLDDAPLLESDLGQRVAQQLGVVEAQAGDDRHQRRQDVRRVQPAAQANLDDGHVHRAGGEVVEGQGGDDFEPGDARRGLDGRAHAIHDGDERRLGDAAIGGVGRQDADAFAELTQVGRGVEADAQPSQPQAGGAHGRHRAFALGAGDVERREAGVRVA